MTAVVHGSFTIERSYAAAPARVFAAWTDVETKARWFIGPPDRWQLVRRELDLRVGGKELLQGELAGGRSTRFEARYHVIVPNERLVYAYDMFAGDQQLSVSLATVELAPARGGGTRMTFTEQAAFLDGADGTESRKHGTAAHFDRLAPVLDDPREIVAARTFDAKRDRLFEAVTDPEQLARWWGPKGFSNTFQKFELRPGGAWRFVMRGPDGTEYPNACEFVEIIPVERVVFRHLAPVHAFTMTLTFTDLGARSLLGWRMTFDDAAEAARVRAVVSEANEQNFDRLAAHLERSAPI